MRRLGRLAITVACMLIGSMPAIAQNYPNRPIHFIVGFAAGGPNDIVARILGEWLSNHMGQQWVIENRAGSGGMLAANSVVNSAPDGYTVMFVAPNNAIGESLYKKLTFNFIRDTVPVAGTLRLANLMIVPPDLPVKTVAEFIAHAKANPGKLNFASSGNGTSVHMSGELFKLMAGIDIVHVPYRGSGPALQDLLAGNIQMAIDTVAVLLPHIQSGSLRALGVATIVRNPTLPDLPPIADTLPGFDGSSINYLNGPAGMAQPVVERLNREINAVLSDPEVAKRMEVAGFTPIVESQPALVARIAQEQEKWRRVIEGIK
jgi:tripartite-type tricarboxylate transporter receptor subunit TctC